MDVLLQLEDDRFKAIFSDDRFEVDKTEEAYRLLAPVIKSPSSKPLFSLFHGFRLLYRDDYSWVIFLYCVSNFEEAGTVVHIGLSLKSNHLKQI